MELQLIYLTLRAGSTLHVLALKSANPSSTGCPMQGQHGEAPMQAVLVHSKLLGSVIESFWWYRVSPSH
jgi:hypothetical protein